MGGRHDERVTDIATDLEMFGFDVHADHIEDFPDPEPINGREPDIVAETGIGRRVIEVDTERTTRDNRQTQDIQEGLGPFDSFERVVLEDESEPEGGPLSLF